MLEVFTRLFCEIIWHGPNVSLVIFNLFFMLSGQFSRQLILPHLNADDYEEGLYVKGMSYRAGQSPEEIR